MTFFPPDVPTDDETPIEPEQNPRWKPSDLELPRLFPISEALAVTDTVAIVVMGARVYSDGVEILIERRIRRGGRSEQEWQLAQWSAHGLHGRPSAGRLRYGVALSDGQQVLLDTFAGFAGDDPQERSRHTLFPTNGSGGGTGHYYRYEDDMWLWPLPPTGPLQIVAQWPDEGVPEARVELDSAPLLDLAESVRPLWTE
ncbi:hypothetical protein [Leifsonia aquatica]|uniref:hypothetical protein n=1 Tax=Leifsonia aquatica TaxID=144185 RepID=UPI003814F182